MSRFSLIILDERMIVMGIDPSIRSTGVCIKSDNTYKYVIIADNPTKKLMSAKFENLTIRKYNKIPQTSKSGIGKEDAKTVNVNEITDIIEDLLDIYTPDYVVIEAVAFQATGTIDQLAGLNYCIRRAVVKHNIPIYAISPTSVKMEFLGTGGATKQMMIYAWARLDDVTELLNYKCDDLADAFALANYPKSRLNT